MPVGPFGTAKQMVRQEVSHSERSRKGRGNGAFLRQGLPPGLHVLGRSNLEVLPQGAPPIVDPEERSAPEKAPDKHDTTQRLAGPPARCAGRFPAKREAGKEAAPQAALRREPVREAVD